MSNEAAFKTPLGRRRFIQVAGLSLVAAAQHPGAAPATAAIAPDPAGCIDAHVHLWSDDLARYPLADGQRREDMRPPSFTPEALFPLMKRAGVGRVNLIQMSYYGADNTYMLDTMAQYPGTFAGTAIVDPLGPDPAGEMLRLAAQTCYSFRIHPAMVKQPPDRWLQLPAMDAMFAAASEHQLALCPLIRVDALPELDRMCAKYPDAPVVIDHLCLIDTESRFEADVNALTAMAKHRNVYVKIGAFYALGKRTPPYLDLLPAIRRVVEAFRPERCLWESDAPFQVIEHGYGDSIALIRDHADFLSASDRDAILRRTAEKLFFRPMAMPNG